MPSLAGVRNLTPMPVSPRGDATPMPVSPKTPMPASPKTPMPASPKTPMPASPKGSLRDPGPVPRPPPREESREPLRHAFPELPGVPEEDPRDEAKRTFEEVLEWASLGDSEPKTEAGLRKCLYLDPHFAQARYLLGTLLEQRGLKADAASEYRRALSALNEGRSRQIPFYLNDERLKTACANALRRLGYP
jgi:chemotaxis protein methyltransferase CheR